MTNAGIGSLTELAVYVLDSDEKVFQHLKVEW